MTDYPTPSKDKERSMPVWFRDLILGLVFSASCFLAGSIWITSVEVAELKSEVNRNTRDIATLNETRYSATEAERDRAYAQRQFDLLVQRLDRMEQKLDRAINGQ